MYVRNSIAFAMRETAPQKHDERVRSVQQQVKDWAKEGRGRKMCTARPGWQAMSLRQGKCTSEKKRFSACQKLNNLLTMCVLLLLLL